MNQYIGTKIIEAEPATYGECYKGSNVLSLAESSREGYRVRYQDGYESWSPKDVFEEAYRRTDGLTFGLAIEAAKKGQKIARRGWNGKGMFVYFVPDGRYPARTDAAKSIAAEDGKVSYGAYLAIKTVQGNVIPWLASQADMLAEDWKVLE